MHLTCEKKSRGDEYKHNNTVRHKKIDHEIKEICEQLLSFLQPSNSWKKVVVHKKYKSINEDSLN